MQKSIWILVFDFQLNYSINLAITLQFSFLFCIRVNVLVLNKAACESALHLFTPYSVKVIFLQTAVVVL